MVSAATSVDFVKKQAIMNNSWVSLFYITQTSHLNLGCDARIYAIFRLCLKLCFPHPFSGTVPTYMLLVAVLGSKRPRQVPTATCVPYKGCGKYSLFHNIEIAYILAISFISKCEVWVSNVSTGVVVYIVAGRRVNRNSTVTCYPVKITGNCHKEER